MRTLHKIALFILLLGIGTGIAKGQGKITFTDEVLYSEDPEIRAIADLWKEYVGKYVANFKAKEKQDLSEYWSEEDRAVEMEDIVASYFSASMPLYVFGENRTFSIRKMTPEIYEIHTLVIDSYAGGSTEQPLFLYTVCAIKEGETFKLANYLTATQGQYSIYAKEDMEYYYPSNYNFDPKKVDVVIQFVRELCEEYAIVLNHPIRYVVGNSLDQCNALIGFPYSIFRSELTYAGLATGSGMILSCQTDHIHELVHAVMKPEFPSAPALFHEGLATFYGGSAGVPFPEHVTLLKEYLGGHPETDLSDFDSYNILIDGLTNPFYTVGALIIDHALVHGGAETVLKLMRYKNPGKALTEVFEIDEDNLRVFLLNLIQ